SFSSRPHYLVRPRGPASTSGPDVLLEHHPGVERRDRGGAEVRRGVVPGGEQRDAVAEEHRIPLQGESVDLSAHRRGEGPTAAEPDALSLLRLELAHDL